MGMHGQLHVRWVVGRVSTVRYTPRTFRVSLLPSMQPDLAARPPQPLTPSLPHCPLCPAVAPLDTSGGACPGTQPPRLSAEQVRAVVFQERAPAGATTLSSMYNGCSYNKTRLTMRNSLVADMVYLPCYNTT